ncbi:hypothetical protein KR215_005491 [Drosophila sulfurigaster]|nr:hypothetical protein KR215_005491 [Drosophila sulfurigaster]
MSGIVPSHPGLQKVGVDPSFATTSPSLAAMSSTRLPRGFVVGMPHSMALELKSPAMIKSPPSCCAWSSIASSFVLNSFILSLGVRYQLMIVQILVCAHTKPCPAPLLVTVKVFMFGSQMAAVLVLSVRNVPLLGVLYCSLMMTTSTAFSSTS